MATEADLQEQVALYLRLHYPDAMFHSDFGSGIKLTPGQAVRQKRQNGGRRAWPDMFIAQAMTTREYRRSDASGYPTGELVIERAPLKSAMGEWGFGDECHSHGFGLFLELKKEGTRLKKKNGDWATEHIAEQAEVLEKLRERGYGAEFAVGFAEAKKMIDGYLGGKDEQNY